MTQIIVKRKSGHIVSVVCDGHTDYGEEGEDIVCAALSSVVQTALLGLLAVARINVETKRDEERGYLEFVLPDSLEDSERHDADVILSTMLAGVGDLAETWSRYIKLEVR